MLVTQRTRKTREFTGPTPHSVAIKARKPDTNKLPTQLLHERKRQKARDEALQVCKYHEKFDLKNDWEMRTDSVIQLKTIQRRVRSAMEKSKLEVDERRQRLRALIAHEEDAYITEMEAKQETTEERQEKMFQRAKMLREKREQERQLIVKDKLDQQWREQCEELRGVLSRRHQDEVCVDRMQQLAIKAEMETRRQEENRMYAELWERDRLAKAAREERETQQQIERNRGMVDVLRTQKAALEAKNQEEKRLIAEEAKLMAEERELRELEEARSKQDKRDKQLEMKTSLDRSTKLKLQREAQERQEELSLDMKILEQLLEESRNEAQENVQRRLQLKDEQQKYRKYLKEQMEEEKRREKELDRLIEEDVERMWAKRIKQWKLEKEARNRLMQDVMETRRKQLHEKLYILAREREELRRNREEMARAIEEHNKMEDERVARTKMINKNHESDLLAQIEHAKNIKEEDKAEEWKQYQEGLKTEAEYQEKLKLTLSSATPPRKIHPRRRAAQQQQQQFEVVGSQMK